MFKFRFIIIRIAFSFCLATFSTAYSHLSAEDSNYSIPSTSVGMAECADRYMRMNTVDSVETALFLWREIVRRYPDSQQARDAETIIPGIERTLSQLPNRKKKHRTPDPDIFSQSSETSEISTEETNAPRSP